MQNAHSGFGDGMLLNFHLIILELKFVIHFFGYGFVISIDRNVHYHLHFRV